ncbi:MAG: DUF2520 domain-containing protein [Candidatus Marinimicrobia bacterium]|nr:DUF2520 domain-containing protein [Candidatus Neomarinimicrobiota bacterium]
MNKTFSLIGTGKIGWALSGLLTDRGWKIVTVHDASEQKVKHYQNHFAPFFLDKNQFLSPTCLFICIKDDNFQELLTEISSNPIWKASHIIHTSGFHNARILKPLQKSFYAEIHSFHPMISVIDTDPEKGKVLLQKAWWALSGDNPEWMKAWADALLLKNFFLPDEKKDFYHAAAVMTANLIIGVLRGAETIASKADISPESYQKIFLPLVDSVVEHIHTVGLQSALGGPIVRKDYALLEREKEALKQAGLVDEYAMYDLLSNYLIQKIQNTE